HTVTFDTKGGSTVTSQTIAHGKKATKPADPTKDETATGTFVFDNWYTSADGGTTLSDTAFDFDTAITEDITLYAKWEKLSRITGGISVTQDLENSDIELSMAQDADAATVTFTAPEGGTSYEWIFDETAVSDIPEICTVSASVLTLHTDRLVKGYYSVVLIMEKDGKSYSAFAQVHVSE
ncbi:MAG: InlB B-repeat-containing protein, partial [Treponema sp.]|nr:InlB B-repeat-containing protein [Treponema sp.]